MEICRDFGEVKKFYVLTKISFKKYKFSGKVLKKGFKLHGAEIRKQIRMDEKRFLMLEFE